MCMHAQSLSRIRLFVTPWTSLPSSPVCRIILARIPEWLSFPSQGNIPDQGSNLCLLWLLHWQADSLALNHREAQGISILLSVMTVLLYIPTNRQEGSLYPTSSPALTVCRFFYDGHSDRHEVYLIVLLICISLIISDVGRLLMS